MREMVYLSESKLGMFLPEHGRGRAWSHLGFKSPVVGVDVDVDRTAASSQQQLAAQLDGVEKALAKKAVPYEKAPGPGQWIKFHTLFNSITIEQEPFGAMVLFVQPSVAAVPHGWLGLRHRLLLHGSPRHLLGRPPQEHRCDVSGSTQVTVTQRSGSDLVEFDRAVSNADLLSDVFGIHPVPMENAEAIEPSGHYFGDALRKFMSAIDGQLDQDTAAWMEGYARVTRSVHDGQTPMKHLVATPLYVMYSMPSEETSADIATG